MHATLRGKRGLRWGHVHCNYLLLYEQTLMGMKCGYTEYISSKDVEIKDQKEKKRIDL